MVLLASVAELKLLCENHMNKQLNVDSSERTVTASAPLSAVSVQEQTYCKIECKKLRLYSCLFYMFNRYVCYMILKLK